MHSARIRICDHEPFISIAFCAEPHLPCRFPGAASGWSATRKVKISSQYDFTPRWLQNSTLCSKRRLSPGTAAENILDSLPLPTPTLPRICLAARLFRRLGGLWHSGRTLLLKWKSAARLGGWRGPRGRAASAGVVGSAGPAGSWQLPRSRSSCGPCGPATGRVIALLPEARADVTANLAVPRLRRTGVRKGFGPVVDQPTDLLTDCDRGT